MFLKTCSKEEIEKIIEREPEGKNTSFLKSSHNLWTRFKNYDRYPAYALYDEGNAVAFVFATLSQRSKYINLYEIVTAETREGKGYAGIIWERVMKEACDKGMTRLKISCTPSSVTWHMRNGLVFWAIDPTGSLRSDQPLFPNRHEQLTFRELALKDPAIALPTDQKVIDKLQQESLEYHKFGPKKTATVLEAIENVGEFWFRDTLSLAKRNSLEEWMVD